MAETPKRNPAIEALEEQVRQLQQDNAMLAITLAGTVLDGLQTQLLRARSGDPGAKEFLTMTRVMLKAILEDEQEGIPRILIPRN